MNGMAPYRSCRIEEPPSAWQEDFLDPLVPDPEAFWSRHRVEHPLHGSVHQGRIRAWLGIDIGSISTNLALIDAEGRLLARRYLRTAGRPIEAVMTGLREIQEEIGERVEVAGVGTTGSGRYMIADVVGADIVRNEITAQAAAATFIDPEVDTIFGIGGQDSKYIGLRNGAVVDFEMNKVCAAGTGSFLEEQAERLSISIRDEFADEAMSSDAPCPLGERCTVFMENSLRELDEALLHLRHNEDEIGLVLLRTRGSAASVLALDATLEALKGDWFVNEVRLLIARVLRRVDLTAKSFFAMVEPGSGFAGTLFELPLAADRSYMLDDEDRPTAVHLSPLNGGTYPMTHGPSRLAVRFLREPGKAEVPVPRS